MQLICRQPTGLLSWDFMIQWNQAGQKACNSGFNGGGEALCVPGAWSTLGGDIETMPGRLPCP